MSRVARLLRHLFQTRSATRRRFTPAVCDAIEAAIKKAEALHCGEIRFVVETDLHPRAIIEGWTPRRRALDLFASLGVWDTEHNNGILLYVLMADCGVEIVADRGFNELVSAEEWRAVCRTLEAAYRSADWLNGSVAGIEAAAELLARHFPDGADGDNALPDRALFL